ncbi:hypothetical protein KQH90_01900 [Anaerosalibacter bizertensis]|uniref:hypothetical protein n=1 Tax=Anaerosalibacter bizertensis TaxID=932217 RepID=UPI001C0F15F3|nr:hypothetical protein [Anaerosalibacter bizertensis]MBU5292790.1 hypothetical protein [Anaerosalibacter bizertensis]
MVKRKPRLLKCRILNVPQTVEEQEEYDKKVCKALATALYRSLEPEQIDSLINQLKEA